MRWSAVASGKGTHTPPDVCGASSLKRFVMAKTVSSWAREPCFRSFATALTAKVATCSVSSGKVVISWAKERETQMLCLGSTMSSNSTQGTPLSSFQVRNPGSAKSFRTVVSGSCV